MLIDSHCHLDMLEGEGTLDPFLIRARAANVGIMVTISTRLSRFELDILPLTVKQPDIYCSVGVHPHYADQEEGSKVEKLLERTKNQKVVAIGETGLDYHYQKSSKKAQKESFLAHIEAARVTKLPLIIHNRDSDRDMMDILIAEKKKKPSFNAILHCFTGSSELAACAVELSIFISFSGIITFKNAGNLRDILQKIPRDLLLIETDAPYLAPVPMRGKKNEPSFLPFTASYIAELLGIEDRDLASLICDNFFRLFSTVPRPTGF